MTSPTYAQQCAATCKEYPHPRKMNDALRAALQMNVGLGGLRIGRELLTQQQINTYLLARLIDLEENEFKMMGALQKLGMDHCDECEDWKPDAEIVQAGDRCQCFDCFEWEYFIREDDSDETIDLILPQLIRRIISTPLLKRLPHTRDGVLEEPFLAEYKRATRHAQ